MKFSSIIAHYSEIALKGKNRPYFEKRLSTNIKRAMKGLPLDKVILLKGRLWLTALEGEHFDERTIARLKTVCGLADFSPTIRVPLDWTAIKEAALSLVQDRQYETFRVSARRSFKDLPFPSQEVNLEVGGYILQHKPAKVRMKGADLEVYIEIMPNGAYLYVDKHQGLGGLPVGSSGSVVCLLSGGIDSPVAAFRMQRRGVHVVFVHFHSHPFHTRASQEKALDLAEILTKYQHKATLYLVPFGELQSKIVEDAPAELRVILYRRFMMRIAEKIAAQDGAKALLTGESLGQVASQTLENIMAINDVATIPVLRPLIGYDKQEIVEQAQKLGTYEISILPDQDCCTLFIPRSPETRAKLPIVERAESTLDIDALVQDALARTERQEIVANWD